METNYEWIGLTENRAAVFKYLGRDFQSTAPARKPNQVAQEDITPLDSLLGYAWLPFTEPADLRTVLAKSSPSFGSEKVEKINHSANVEKWQIRCNA